MNMFSNILNNIKIDDKIINENIKRYEDNLKQERIFFLKNTTPKEYWKADINLIDKQIKNFINNKKIFCWLWGDKGRGKTYSLYAIRNYYIMQKGHIYFEITMEGELNYDINFKNLNAVDNLAISENKMKFLADYYFNLIDWCWKNHKKLYLTSTKSLVEWLNFLSKYNLESGEAIASRFSNNIDCIELIGNDRRKILNDR